MAGEQSSRSESLDATPGQLYEVARKREQAVCCRGARWRKKPAQDVWSHKPVSLDAIVGQTNTSLSDFMSSYDRDPFGLCIVSGFEDDLSEREQMVAEQMVAGYTDKESALHLGLTIATLRMMKAEVRSKAMEHLA